MYNITQTGAACLIRRVLAMQSQKSVLNRDVTSQLDNGEFVILFSKNLFKVEENGDTL
jgi:hypothetical protein